MPLFLLMGRQDLARRIQWKAITTKLISRMLEEMLKLLSSTPIHKTSVSLNERSMNCGDKLIQRDKMKGSI